MSSAMCSPKLYHAHTQKKKKKRLWEEDTWSNRAGTVQKKAANISGT